jgi:hypothetical protein
MLTGYAPRPARARLEYEIALDAATGRSVRQYLPRFVTTMMTQEQQAVAAGMAAGVVCTAPILACPTHWFGTSIPAEATSLITFALRADAIAMLRATFFSHCICSCKPASTESARFSR